MPPRRPRMSASTIGERCPYRARLARATAVRSRAPKDGMPPLPSTSETISVPEGRAATPGRGTHRATTAAVSPAATGRPCGHIAPTGSRQPLVGCSNSLPPVESTGSSNRTSSRSCPTGSCAAHRPASPTHAILALRWPSSAPAASMMPRPRRTMQATASIIAATPNTAGKCKRPVARPAPYATVSRIGGRSLTAPLHLARSGSSSPATPGRDRYLAQCLHHNHLDGGSALLFLQAHFRDDRSLPTRDIARRNPIQRESQHVVPAEVATTVGWKKRPQSIVGRGNMVFDQVLYHRTASWACSAAPVNVEPVVPVKRTVWYSPTDERGRSTRTR